VSISWRQTNSRILKAYFWNYHSYIERLILSTWCYESSSKLFVYLSSVRTANKLITLAYIFHPTLLILYSNKPPLRISMRNFKKNKNLKISLLWLGISLFYTDYKPVHANYSGLKEPTNWYRLESINCQSTQAFFQFICSYQRYRIGRSREWICILSNDFHWVVRGAYLFRYGFNKLVLVN